jgi:hypothetical protein
VGIIRTSRTLLTKDRVRVDRRIRHRDGIGGSFETWSTIIPRYWVRLWPDHHDPRHRIETGEVPDEPTHSAVGARTLNGITVMVGDRFIDEGDNEIYDVLGVRRPRATSTYNVGLVRYTLRQVRDDYCVAGVPGYGGVTTQPGAAIGTGTTPGLSGSGAGSGAAGAAGTGILRHFDDEDLAAIRLGTFDYGDFDGFVYGHYDVENETVNALISQAKRCFRYFALLNFPFAHPSEDEEGWFSFFRTTVQAGWGARFVSGSTAGQFSTLCVDTGSPCGGGAEYRELVDFSQLTGSRPDEMLDKMMTFAPDSMFFDQAWLEPPAFFWCGHPDAVGSTCGVCKSCVNLVAYTGANRALFESRFPAAIANQKSFIELAQSRLSIQGGYALSNGRPNLGDESVGGTTVPRPVLLENSGLGSGIDPVKLVRWRDDPRNVLSIDITAAPAALPPSFTALKNEFAANGGWVSLTGPASTDPNMTEAYRQLAEVKP